MNAPIHIVGPIDRSGVLLAGVFLIRFVEISRHLKVVQGCAHGRRPVHEETPGYLPIAGLLLNGY